MGTETRKQPSHHTDDQEKPSGGDSLPAVEEAAPKVSFTETYFKGETPEEKIREVYEFAASLGLKPEEACVRVFDVRGLGVMRVHGTDRAGIGETGPRSYDPDDMWGYKKALHSRGLKLEDGLYAVPLPRFADDFGKTLFERGVLRTAGHRVAVAVYRSQLLEDIPNKYGGKGEFYAFKDPDRKREALAGVITQKPLEIEAAFSKLGSVPEKLSFVQDLLAEFSEEKGLLIRELVLDLKEEISHNLRQTEEPKAKDELQEQLAQADALAAECFKKRQEVTFLAEMSHQTGLAREREAVSAPLIGFVVDEVSQELDRGDISDSYRRKLQELLEKARGVAR